MGTSILGPENEITIIQGTSKTFRLHVTDAEETDVDLTGAVIYLTIKCDLDDPAPTIQKISTDVAQIDIDEPREGQALIFFVPADTQNLDSGEYIYDVLVIDATGGRHVVIGPDPFFVTRGATRVP